MKKIIMITALITAISFTAVKAQILTPVHWSYASKRTSATEAIIFIKATIDQGWHIYSQFVKEGGPVKTTFTFSPSKEYTLVATTLEPKPIIRMEKVFNMEVGFFENTVIFRQKVKLKKGQVIIKGSLEYMTCNDEKCLPPTDEEFSIPVK